MKFLVVLAVVGVANCGPLFGANYLELETNAAGQITDVDVERGSVALHAANSPLVTSYSAAGVSPFFYNAPALTHAAPSFYNAPLVSAPITYRAPTPVVYRAPTPVVYRAPAPLVVQAPPKVVTYHAPAPAPVVVQSPPQVVVKTVQAPAPAPIVKTVYVPVDDSAEDEAENPSVYRYTAAETEDSDEDVAVVYSVPQASEDSDEDRK